MGEILRYVVGNTSGRDHINWPTKLRSELAGALLLTPPELDTYFPVDVSLAQIMALCWRVKKWTFNGALEASIHYEEIPGDNFLVIDATGAAELDETEVFTLKDDGSPATTERDLVCREADSTYRALVNRGIGPPDGVGIVSNWTNNGVQSTFGSPSPFSFSGSTPADNSGFQFQIFNGFFVGFDAGVFMPPFVVFNSLLVNSSIQVGIIANRNPQTILSGSGPTVLRNPSAITIDLSGMQDWEGNTIPNFDLPIEITWRLGGMSPGSACSGTADGGFTLKAVEFFEYANRAGAPVYDAGGALLVSPFS